MEGSPSKLTKAKTTPVIKSVSTLNEELMSRRRGEIMPVTSAQLSPQGAVTKASCSGELLINGQSRSSTARTVVRPPLIDESLIADDNEGLPLISAVYSLAANGDQDGGEASAIQGMSVRGSKLDSSKKSSPQIIKTQRVVSPTPSSPSRNRLSDATEVKQVSKFKTINESTELNERKTSPRSLDDGERIHPSVANSVTKTHSSANVMQLVKLVDSVHKQVSPSRQSLTSASANGQSASVSPTSLTSSSLVKPVTQPRQIAMKPPPTSTSIVLNLKPGEALPKAINVLGPDGKTVVVLSLTGDGGKPFSSQVSQSGGRIVIPLPANVSPKQGTVVNKVVGASSGKVPIAPHPGRATVLSPKSGNSSPLPPSASDSSLLQKTPITRTENGATRTSPSNDILNLSETRPPVIVESQNPESVSQGDSKGLSATKESNPAAVASPEATPTPSTSTGEKQEGLSPHEARIHRLKELIKAQEEAVNKLREKRRLEIERIRNDSTSSPENENDTFKPERPPLVEQKSSSSPFAVPLPPKKRIREQDTGVKTKLPKSTESSGISNEGAFIPNGDDKSFVQLVGLENVVNNIK